MADDEINLEKARSHMTAVAVGLVRILGPLDAAGVLGGAMIGVLAEEFGNEKAVEYLRGLADELDHSEDAAPRHGHA